MMINGTQAMTLNLDLINRRTFLNRTSGLVALCVLPRPLGNTISEIATESVSSVSAQSARHIEFSQRVRMISRLVEQLTKDLGINRERQSPNEIFYVAQGIARLLDKQSLTEAQAKTSLRKVLSFGQQLTISVDSVKNWIASIGDAEIEAYSERLGFLSDCLLDIFSKSEHDLIRNKEEHLDSFMDLSRDVSCLMTALAAQPNYDPDKAKRQVDNFVTHYCRRDEDPTPARSSDVNRENLAQFHRRP